MARFYGDLTYGDGYYGSGVPTDTAPTWQDITRQGIEVEILRGDSQPRLSVDVSSCSLRFLDLDGDLFPMTPDLDAERPGVGTFLRVSVIDPQGDFEPLFVGRVDAIEDVHDADRREVTVQCFGVESDLSTALLDYSAPNDEPAGERCEDVLTRAGWTWQGFPEPGEFGWPGGVEAGDTPKLRDVELVDGSVVTGLVAIDSAANGAGWVFDIKRDGAPRVTEFPLIFNPITQLPIEVTDCKGDDLLLASPSITFAQDATETLNVVEVLAAASPIAGAEQTFSAEDPESIARVGRRSQSMGFPATGSVMTDDVGQAFVDRVLAFYKDSQTRVARLVADSRVDARWLDQLVTLDRGTPVYINRQGFSTKILEVFASTVGYVHLITRDGWQAEIATTTELVVAPGAPTDQYLRTVEDGTTRTTYDGSQRTYGS